MAEEEISRGGHRIVRKSGLVGVYDILQCKDCGVSRRCGPDAVTFGHYSPIGNVLGAFEKIDCSKALIEDTDEELVSAYVELFDIYNRTDKLRALIPDCPVGHWPQIAIGRWGTPKIEFWDGWLVELVQMEVGIYHEIPDCGCHKGPCHPRVLLSPKGEARFEMPHGMYYDDQTVAPPELEGWEAFRQLAMTMYELPAPKDGRKWFGNYWELDLGGIFDQCVEAAGEL